MLMQLLKYCPIYHCQSVHFTFRSIISRASLLLEILDALSTMAFTGHYYYVKMLIENANRAGATIEVENCSPKQHLILALKVWKAANRVTPLWTQVLRMPTGETLSTNWCLDKISRHGSLGTMLVKGGLLHPAHQPQHHKPTLPGRWPPQATMRQPPLQQQMSLWRQLRVQWLEVREQFLQLCLWLNWCSLWAQISWLVWLVQLKRISQTAPWELRTELTHCMREHRIWLVYRHNCRPWTRMGPVPIRSLHSKRSKLHGCCSIHTSHLLHELFRQPILLSIQCIQRVAMEQSDIGCFSTMGLR